MENILLGLMMAAFCVAGYFVMTRVDRFIDECSSAPDNAGEGKEKSREEKEADAPDKPERHKNIRGINTSRKHLIPFTIRKQPGRPGR